MFIVCRKISGKAKSRIAICQSVRSGKKVIQKTIKYFGIAHNEEQRLILLDQAKTELLKLSIRTSHELSSEKTEKKQTDPCEGALLGHMVERFRITEGFHIALGPVFDQLNLKPLLSNIRYNQLKDVVIARIAEPSSKLCTANLLTNKFHRELSEDQIYQLMDELVDLEDKIKLKVFEASNKNAENQTTNLLLFDVTTLYFESQKNDDLREFGYSKDHKVGETQVVLALATTSIGAPIGYHLFKGNKAEVSTLLECLEKWKTVFSIKDVTVVADRAMMSDDNSTKMESSTLNFNYVIAAKLKKLPKELREKILDRKSESAIEFEGDAVFVQEHEYEGRRLIVQFSPRRAEKDEKDRERLLEKIKKKLNKSNAAKTQKLITNKGYLKFLDDNKKGEAVLNEAKILEDKRWDGLHGVISNDKESKASALLSRYRRLWVIEESFRINKHNLAMRPIYHFTPNRIKMHVLICYLAFAVTRYAQQKIHIFDAAISIEKMRSSLEGVQSSILEDTTTGLFYKVPSQVNKETAIIYRALGIQRTEGPSKYILKSKCSGRKKI